MQNTCNSEHASFIAVCASPLRPVLWIYGTAAGLSLCQEGLHDLEHLSIYRASCCMLQ